MKLSWLEYKLWRAYQPAAWLQSAGPETNIWKHVLDPIVFDSAEWREIVGKNFETSAGPDGLQIGMLRFCPEGVQRMILDMLNDYLESGRMFVCLSVVCLFVCLFVCWFVCVWVYLFVCLFVCLLSVCLCVCLFVCLCVCLSVCLVVCLCVCLFVWLFVCLCVTCMLAPTDGDSSQLRQ